MKKNNVSWVALKTIVRREVVRFLRVWTQSILPSAITMALYFIIFGNFVGRRIGEIHGFSYVAFITPGLIMMSIITNAYSNVSSSFYINKFSRSIEELMVAPVPNSIIILGYTLGGVLRGFVVGAVVIGISLFFTHLHLSHIGLILLVVLLSSTMFSLAALINAILANDWDDIAIFPTFVLTPLTYLGGVFYSVAMLPSMWQTVSQYNPVLYMVNAFRYAMIGYADVGVQFSIFMMAVFTVILYAVCWYLLDKGIGLKT